MRTTLPVLRWIISVMIGLSMSISVVYGKMPCKTIVVIGDSLSAAYNMPVEKGWVSLLETRLKSQKPCYCVVNASVGGDTSQEALAKLPALIKAHHPSLVIVQIGGNDGLRGLPIDNLERNIARMITLLQTKRISVLLVGVRLPPNYGPDYIQSFVDVYSRLAKRYQVALVPQILAGVADLPERMQDDGVHPKAEAQTQVLENIWTVLGAMLQRCAV